MSVVADPIDGGAPIIDGLSADPIDAVIVAGRQAMEHGMDHLMNMAPAALEKDLMAHRESRARISAESIARLAEFNANRFSGPDSMNPLPFRTVERR